jgi:hypothetical protein
VQPLAACPGRDVEWELRSAKLHEEFKDDPEYQQRGGKVDPHKLLKLVKEVFQAAQCLVEACWPEDPAAPMAYTAATQL